MIADLGKQKLRLDDQLHRGEDKADFAGADNAGTWSVAEFFRKRRRNSGGGPEAGEEDVKDHISSSSLEIESTRAATSSRAGTSRKISEEDDIKNSNAGGTENYDEVDVNVNEDGVFGADAVAASFIQEKNTITITLRRFCIRNLPCVTNFSCIAKTQSDIAYSSWLGCIFAHDKYFCIAKMCKSDCE